MWMNDYYFYFQWIYLFAGITPLGDGTAYVNCDCSIPGYISVYLVRTHDNKPLLEMTETFEFDKYIRFRYSNTCIII